MLPIPAHISSIQRPVQPLLLYYFFFSVATFFAFPVTMTVLYFRYHTMRYRFDEEGIHMSWGIIMRREVLLNYARIQDIQLRANVVERWLRLARIEIQTASGSATSTMIFEGLENHEAMRDFLHSRMRGAQEKRRTEPVHASALDALAATLDEIAAELRAIRTQIENLPHA